MRSGLSAPARLDATLGSDEVQASNRRWDDYEAACLTLLREREVERTIPRSLFNKRSVLLCSEATAEHCHRRLAAEYPANAWGGVDIIHL